jgi:hypothetical protein
MSSITKFLFFAIISAVIFSTNSRIIMNEEAIDNEVVTHLQAELKRFGRKLHGPEDHAVGECSTNP